ncbi:cytidylyltransferase domain-containing protein [Eisenbergiella porci]|uniref:cytidylyltransferase domain-containing protein n=1 Tax=Eisenbergiella porci TaxID=2652274 RepID=UPI002A82433E|nr:cytidyltransferase [Eisenbergiella porci]
MKILAVIPARAGSKGIPNKNIRIIGGHPLIYYSIKNALSSGMITDVIVSTDSTEVKIIANQMGANVKWRDAALCGDAVTLDAVIADAVPEGEWDYVVTMQPTSPTLRVSTLDAAIKYTIDNGLDTVISAINAPHLSWGEKDGKKVPNYTERLNRQYLPPCYMETGAFVVSRASVVTPKTRIGAKVDVYEVPEDESQDVDTFEDLRSVAATLDRQKVAIYVNGNNKRGIGHIYRALEMADEFYVKPDIYYDTNQTDPKVFGKTTHNLIPVNGIAELFDRCKQNEYTVFINDILTTSIDYMIGLRSVLPKAEIVNFEDDGEGIIKADLVFNALFHENEYPQIHAGEKYYIAGKTFMFYEPIEIKEKVKRVFISFGGADPQNYSDRLLNMICKPEYKDYEFVVVLGRAKYNVEALMDFNKYDNIEVLYDVSNMPELMTSCDVGITSRGRTGYELAILGIPSISMAQNQREEKHGFVCNENGFTYIGLNPDDEIIESNLKMYLNMSKGSREKFHNMLLSHDLRGGRKRVMSLINSL